MLRWLKYLLRVLGIFICLVGVFLGVTLLTLRILVPPQKKIEVPSITGKDVKEALILVSEQGLALKMIGKRYEPQIPQGVIISQFPSPGTKVRRNREIKVFISEGTRTAVVPSLIGKKVREAKIYLSQRGLNFGNTSYTYARFPQDEIISQGPSPQTEINTEDGINVLVSLGRRNPGFYMPEFMGRKIEEAKDIFEKLSLKIGKIKESPSSGEEGVILSQVPLPGTRVDCETSIELVVSTFYKEKQSFSPKVRWIPTLVEVPLGLTKKRVSVVIVDSQGRRTIDYGEREAGEKVRIISKVVGRGEIRIYVDGELVKIENVEE